MAGNSVELGAFLSQFTDNRAKEISYLWDKWSQLRNTKIKEWQDLRDYIFATSTRTTQNKTLPWKNSTTLPKLCQLRDNLHANYISSIFPNDNWIKWEGKSLADETYQKKNAIQSYIGTKAHQGNLRDVVSQLLYDYIDYGIVIGTAKYVKEDDIDTENNKIISGFRGPKAVRISPLDIVFNPVATSFRDSPKILRSIKTVGDLYKLAQTNNDWKIAFEKTREIRKNAGAYTADDFKKALGYSVDGFGDMREYYGSDYVEILTFEGDYYNKETEVLEENIQIIIIDRSIIVSNKKIPSPLGKDRIAFAGWRKRPDNLYAMGPLDNLVGMQYRIDHLENLKADAMDLMIHPPLVIQGDVDEFVWGPNAEIHIVGEGSVTELGMNFAGVASADNQIAILEQRMEEYAGAPKQAMGIRTPGEKTAFEVQALENAAGRIFQEKIVNFEVNILEPILNCMLAETIAANDVSDWVRVFDEQLGVVTFQSVSVNDLKAQGTVRPIGARHFGQQAQVLQNINLALSSAIGPLISPHMSGKQMARILEDSLQLQRYSMVRPWVALTEQSEGQQLGGALQEEVAVEQSIPIE